MVEDRVNRGDFLQLTTWGDSLHSWLGHKNFENLKFGVGHFKEQVIVCKYQQILEIQYLHTLYGKLPKCMCVLQLPENSNLEKSEFRKLYAAARVLNGKWQNFVAIIWISFNLLWKTNCTYFVWEYYNFFIVKST